MNILSISAITGGQSHLIPLFVLHQRYFRRLNNVNNFFLVSNENKKLFEANKINCVDIDYKINSKSTLETIKNNIEEIKAELLLKEQKSVALVNPKIIIEDNCFTSPLIAEKNNIPRISIHRTGFFRSIDKKLRNKNHFHSAEKDETGKQSSYLFQFFNNKTINSNWTSEQLFLQNYLHAKSKVIPGIPSIEVLPHNIANPKSYFYSGPLIVEDNPSPILLEEIQEFLISNKNRKKVFITTGLIDNTSISKYINYLIENDYSVISTNHYELKEKYHSQFFFNKILPLNFISSCVDLLIHQCGSGMYHYPILNNKPSITLGTQCYDREDVAMRLEQLNISKHVPHPKDDPNYFNIFLSHIKDFENNTICNFDTLKMLKEEIYDTMLNFDIEALIKYTLSD